MLSSHDMKTGNSSSRVAGQSMVQLVSVEKEVDKVVAVGTAIGYDFSKGEEGIKAVIARREEEDNAIYDDISAVCGGFCFGCGFWVLARAAQSVVPYLALLLFGSCQAVSL
ncbi:hypothetical protein QYF36_009726 [Acer negundo]|nr:hypothetical protein QYF36_009726 [Acer negundo]